MRNFALSAAAFGVASCCFIWACSKNEEQPPPTQPGQYPYQQPAAGQQPYPQQQPGYPAQQPGYPPAAQQPGYPAQQPGYPAAPAAAPAPAPGAAPTSTPSAVAFPCQTDIQCLSHRCNMTVGKCSWPCQSADDCQPGFQCVTPASVPMLPKQ